MRWSIVATQFAPFCKVPVVRFALRVRTVSLSIPSPVSDSFSDNLAPA